MNDRSCDKVQSIRMIYNTKFMCNSEIEIMTSRIAPLYACILQEGR